MRRMLIREFLIPALSYALLICPVISSPPFLSLGKAETRHSLSTMIPSHTYWAKALPSKTSSQTVEVPSSTAVARTFRACRHVSSLPTFYKILILRQCPQAIVEWR
jgi:hypothetical protein